MEYWVLKHSNGRRLPTLQMWAVDLDSEWYPVVVTFQNHHFLDIFWKKRTLPGLAKQELSRHPTVVAYQLPRWTTNGFPKVPHSLLTKDHAYPQFISLLPCSFSNSTNCQRNWGIYWLATGLSCEENFLQLTCAEKTTEDIMKWIIWANAFSHN